MPRLIDEPDKDRETSDPVGVTTKDGTVTLQPPPRVLGQPSVRPVELMRVRSAVPGLVVFFASFGMELMLECVSVIGDQPSSLRVCWRW